ncbi:unnamed protein product, partial [Ectocarpus sp. 4 AP-2014]
MWGIFALFRVLLLSMGRARVDPEQAQKAVDAVRSVEMSLRVAAETYGLPLASLHDRVKKKVAIDAKVGPGTVLSKEEEDFVQDVLIYASRHLLLAVGSEGAERCCAQHLQRPTQVPWNPDKGPGDSWLEGFMARHPGLSERATHIYETNRINEDDERRLEAFYKAWAEYLAETKLPPERILNTDETNSIPQGSKSGKAIVATGTKVPCARRFNSRENTTVVATIGAGGRTFHPTIIFKGQRMQPAWIQDNNGVPDAKYTVTESSFIRSHVFLDYLRDLRQRLDARGLQGKTALVLDGQPSHTTFDVIGLALSLDIDAFQLPSHTSHITQPLDVGTFGILKKEITKVLTAYPLKNGGRSPVKRYMAGVVAEAWIGSFTPENNMAAFKGAGLWPVNMENAINRLHRKRKQRDNDRPFREDLAVVASKEQLERDLGRASLLELKRHGLVIEGLHVNTVFLVGLARLTKRTRTFATVR